LQISRGAAAGIPAKNDRWLINAVLVAVQRFAMPQRSIFKRFGQERGLVVGFS
jgi:hypothetical protein